MPFFQLANREAKNINDFFCILRNRYRIFSIPVRAEYLSLINQFHTQSNSLSRLASIAKHDTVSDRPQPSHRPQARYSLTHLFGLGAETDPQAH